MVLAQGQLFSKTTQVCPLKPRSMFLRSDLSFLSGQAIFYNYKEKPVQRMVRFVADQVGVPCSIT